MRASPPLILCCFNPLSPSPNSPHTRTYILPVDDDDGEDEEDDEESMGGDDSSDDGWARTGKGKGKGKGKAGKGGKGGKRRASGEGGGATPSGKVDKVLEEVRQLMLRSRNTDAPMPTLAELGITSVREVRAVGFRESV
jgi:hypothetical protein